jgi:hypothetical protein
MCGIRLLVKMRFSYRNRDGSERSTLRAEKRLVEWFVPQVGMDILVEGEDCDVSSTVSSVWWRSDAEADKVIVHTEEQVYSDGNVDKSRDEHIKLLESRGWTCFISK